jgi:glucose/arabinose dehydrogenase
MFSAQPIRIISLFLLCFIIFLQAANSCLCIPPVSGSKSSELVLVSNEGRPTIKDPDLKIELVSRGLHRPTSMAFLGPDDILVLEKDNGTVRRIVNGNVLAEPLLDVPVAINAERGMLGVAAARDETTKTIHVFLYYTESEKEDGEDFSRAKEPLGNRLYRYEFVGNRLVDSKLLLDYPTGPKGRHNGGVTLVGPDNNLYLAIGDLEGSNPQGEEKLLDGRSGILAINQDGKALDDTPKLGDGDPLDKYYAYGIRNSFGLDFDPVTGNLWDTENGVNCCDEINLVEPGFNSGWKEIQGIWKYDKIDGGTAGLAINPRSDLVDFNGRGKYSPPEFIWKSTVGPTALKFFNSDKYGKEYENDLFVGSSHGRSVFHFELDHNREGLSLDGGLMDRIADDRGELQRAIFAEGFDFITDMDIGPDGYLYILSYEKNRVSIIKIVPSNIEANSRSEDIV